MNTPITIPIDETKIRQAIANSLIDHKPERVSDALVTDFKIILAHYIALLDAPGEPEPFDLERAKAGEAVQTRSGLPWRLIAEVNSELPLVGCVTEKSGMQWACQWRAKGMVQGELSPIDLFMSPRQKPTRIVWLNVYPDSTVASYDSKEEADDEVGDDRIACIPVAIPTA